MCRRTRQQEGKFTFAVNKAKRNSRLHRRKSPGTLSATLSCKCSGVRKGLQTSTTLQGLQPRLLCSRQQDKSLVWTFSASSLRSALRVGARPLSEARAQDDHDASHSCRLQRGGPGGGDLPGVLRTEQPSSRRRSDQQRGVRGVQACGVRRVRLDANTGRSRAVPDV